MESLKQKVKDMGGSNKKDTNKTFRCYECGNEGHLAKNCSQRLKRIRQEERDSTFVKNKKYEQQGKGRQD